VLSADVKVDEEGKFGTGGNVTLRLGKKTIGEGRFEQQVAGYFTVNETFDVGCDTVSPVSDLYESPFAFTGTILRVMVDISQTTFEDLAEQHEMHARLAMATQ
jgi:arylsulfatase